MTSRGNGYWESDYGCFDAALIASGDYLVGDVMIARTDGDLVIGYIDSCSKRDVQEVEAWAAEYGFEIEWR